MCVFNLYPVPFPLLLKIFKHIIKTSFPKLLREQGLFLFLFLKMLATTFYLGSSISDMNFYFDPSMPFLPFSQVDFFLFTPLPLVNHCSCILFPFCYFPVSISLQQEFLFLCSMINKNTNLRQRQ